MSRRRAWTLVWLAIAGYFLYKVALKGTIKWAVAAGGPWWESFALAAAVAILVGLFSTLTIVWFVATRRFARLDMRRSGWGAFQGTVAGMHLRVARPRRGLVLGMVDATKWVWSAPVRGSDGSSGWALATRPGKDGVKGWKISAGPAWQDFFLRNELWLATAPPDVAGFTLRDGKVHVETERSIAFQDLDRLAHWTGDLARRLERRLPSDGHPVR